MDEHPPLTEADIRVYVGERSFDLGRDYFLYSAIQNPIRQGTVLKANYTGSSANDYRLFAELGRGGILRAHCSCQEGAGGRCKHVAALLLTWLDDPGTFVEIEELGKVVGALSKEDLVELVLQLVASDPDLETMVRLNAAAAEERGQPVDPETIRDWAEQAIVKNQEGLGEPLEIVTNLQPILVLGKRYEQKGNVLNAAIVYRTLALTVLDYDLSLLQDEEGRLHGIVWECVHGLGNTLGVISDPESRQQILEALFDIYIWDVNSGSVGTASAVPDIFRGQATREEREWICRWIQELLPKGDAWQERYLRHVWGTLWLDLGAEWLDEETFLKVCRQAGLVPSLVDRLIQSGKMEEAYQEARQASDEELLSLADLLAAQGETGLARDLVQERAQASQDSRFKNWLNSHEDDR